ncbi:MAG TPA: MarR family transcriptional regulator [Gemmatimonadales bacterium]|nr:MarR family transcriptional regulator [Gemmatimonadales bacterium]
MAERASPPAPPPTAVADRLHSAAIHLLRTLRREDQALGVGPAKLSALSVLVFGGPRSIGALARAEHVRLPTMSRLVSGLERDGLATRTPDPEDGRASRVYPTAHGRRVLHQGRARRVATLARRLEQLPEADRALLARAADLIEGLT